MKPFFDYDRTQETIDFIQESSRGAKLFVGFSGGKDSIVLAKVLEMAKVDYQLYYSFTGIDPPEVVQFIKKEYPSCIFLRPRRTYWKSLITNCPPSDSIRWCCTTLKKEPGLLINLDKRFMGIRAEESTRRAKYKEINYFEKTGHTQYYPIFKWKEYQIWDFIESNKLPYPVLYDWGFSRIGCIICPYHNKALNAKYRERWPKYFECFEHYIELLWQKRVAQGKIMFYNSSKEFVKHWYSNQGARWYAPPKIDKINFFNKGE